MCTYDYSCRGTGDDSVQLTSVKNELISMSLNLNLDCEISIKFIYSNVCL